MESIERLNNVLKRVSAALDMTASGNPADAVLRLHEMLVTVRQDLLSAKEDALALKERNLELEQRLRNMERFEAERERYLPNNLETGSVVYLPKEVAEAGGKEGPYLCAHCFERGERSYLQPPEKRSYYREAFSCSTCGYKAIVPNELRPRAHVPPKKTAWDDFP